MEKTTTAVTAEFVCPHVAHKNSPELAITWDHGDWFTISHTSGTTAKAFRSDANVSLALPSLVAHQRVDISSPMLGRLGFAPQIQVFLL